MVRRVAMAVVTVLCVLGLVGASTMALFGVGVKGTGASVIAGVLDLRIKNNVTGWLDRLPEDKPTWTMSNMSPGEYMDYAYSQVREIGIRNAVGALPGSTVDLGVVNQVIDPAGPASDTEEGTTDMGKVMQIVSMEYVSTKSYMIVDSTGESPSLLHDVNGNGWLDLDDLEKAPVQGLAAPNSVASVQMRLRYRPEADSDYQGDSLVSELRVTEHQ